jgi:predicted Zn-dependent protease
MKGNVEAAEPLLVQVLNDSPNQPFVNHSLGLIERSRGNAAKAEQFLEEEIRLHPPAVPARRAMVEVLAEQRRYQDQLTQLQSIQEVERPNPLTLHSVAQALFNLGSYPEAKKALTACTTLDARYAGCWMLLANVHQKQGKPEEAQTAYKRAMELAKRPQ